MLAVYTRLQRLNRRTFLHVFRTRHDALDIFGQKVLTEGWNGRHLPGFPSKGGRLMKKTLAYATALLLAFGSKAYAQGGGGGWGAGGVGSGVGGATGGSMGGAGSKSGAGPTGAQSDTRLPPAPNSITARTAAGRTLWTRAPKITLSTLSLSGKPSKSSGPLSARRSSRFPAACNFISCLRRGAGLLLKKGIAVAVPLRAQLAAASANKTALYEPVKRLRDRGTTGCRVLTPKRLVPYPGSSWDFWQHKA